MGIDDPVVLARPWPYAVVKGPVINYWEGRATKCENRRSGTLNFCAPAPSRQGETFHPPSPLRGNIKIPHSRMTKTCWLIGNLYVIYVCDKSQKALCTICLGYRITM